MKDFFDPYCIEDSTLPEEAKNFKTLKKKYYKYPAICFKTEDDKIQKLLKWLSKKTKRDIVIPTLDQWSYVATNKGSTDYCLGDEEVEDLADSDRRYENILMDLDDDPDKILKVASFAPNKDIKVYDMCGNLYEMVDVDGEIMYVGNSYSSYIVKSSEVEAEDITEEVGPSLGLRVFYIEDLADE